MTFTPALAKVRTKVEADLKIKGRLKIESFHLIIAKSLADMTDMHSEKEEVSKSSLREKAEGRGNSF